MRASGTTSNLCSRRFDSKLCQGFALIWRGGVDAQKIFVEGPEADIGLPRGTLLDSFRSIVRSLLASSEVEMDSAQEPMRHDYPRTSSSACAGRLE
jgi:hypothetical protein